MSHPSHGTLPALPDHATAVPMPDAGDGTHWSQRFAFEVLEGLGSARKQLSCTWLYDQRGSELFEAITQVPEYYPTRTEVRLLQRCAEPIAELAGRGATVIELGSGSSRKTPLLLAALQEPAAYVPVDVAERFLTEAVAALQPRFPRLPMRPLVADFTRLGQLPARQGPGRPLVFFPGSTIGNLDPEAAMALMRRLGDLAGPDALLVIGADATQDPSLLLPAYDDAAGVTAAFNKNLLVRINRELGADFDVEAFDHRAVNNARRERVEMHLVSLRPQTVRLLGRCFTFEAGETVHTENSYKYGLLRFQAMAARAGWTERQLWVDSSTRYALHVLSRTGVDG